MRRLARDPGLKLNVAKEVKPLLDRAVNEQIAALQARVRNDPFLENAARREWAKMCRSIPLGAAAPGMPNLWLELRPTRAFAAQPRIDANALTLTSACRPKPASSPTRPSPIARSRRNWRSCRSWSRARQYRRADRHAVHRGQPAAGSAVEGQDIPGGRERRVRGHGAGRERRSLGRPAADLAAGQGATRTRAGSASAPRRRSMSGAGRCSIASSRCCA